MITRAGRKTNNIEPDDSAAGEAGERPNNQSTPSREASNERSRDGAPRPGSKLALAVDMLTAQGGTTIAALVATAWLPTRTVLTGLRRRGYQIEKEPTSDGPPRTES